MKLRFPNILLYLICLLITFIILAPPTLLHAQACNDGIDNDADGLIDFPQDPDCLNAADTFELKPTLVGSYNASFYGAVTLNDNYAYVAAGTPGLHIIDVSDPTNPILVGNYQAPFGRNIFYRANTAYVACFARGLKIIDVTTSSNPTLLYSYNFPDFTTDVHVVGDFAYVANTYQGMHIININDPTQPTYISTYETRWTSDQFGFVTVKGNLAYVSSLLDGTYIIDVSNPNNPTMLGNYDTIQYPNKIFVDNGYAYLPLNNYGLEVIDVSDPTNPTFVGNYDTPGLAYGVYVFGSLAYVADYGGGLQILNVSDSSNPILAGIYQTTANAIFVQVRDDYAYLANGSDGLKIISLNSTDSDGDGMPNHWEIAYECMDPFYADDDLDYDYDDLFNGDEYLENTDPCDEDTEDDEMTDGWEVEYSYCGLDPLGFDPDADYDHDELVNLGEFLAQTNPCEDDTDDDGLTDGFEEQDMPCLDPLNPDTDGDGFTDGDEINLYNTDPCVADGDTDGMDDEWENDYSYCGLDSTIDDSQGDADNDGLTNLDEYLLGTDPCDPDTDRDCVLDKVEVDDGDNPLDPTDQAGCEEIITPGPEGWWRLHITLLEAPAMFLYDVYLALPEEELLIQNSSMNIGRVATTELYTGETLLLYVQIHSETPGLSTYDHYSDSMFARVTQIDDYTYLIGFEVLPLGLSNWDFEDAVLLVEFIEQTPEPGLSINYLGETQMIGTGSPDEKTKVSLDQGSNTSVTIPTGALTSEAGVILTQGMPELYEYIADPSFIPLGYFKVTLANGQVEMVEDKNAKLSISYLDQDGDGYVDGTQVRCGTLKLAQYNEATMSWNVLASEADPFQKTVEGKTSHLCLFSLGYINPDFQDGVSKNGSGGGSPRCMSIPDSVSPSWIYIFILLLPLLSAPLLKFLTRKYKVEI